MQHSLYRKVLILYSNIPTQLFDKTNGFVTWVGLKIYIFFVYEFFHASGEGQPK